MKTDVVERIDSATRTRKINATTEAPGSLRIEGSRIDEDRLTQRAQTDRFAVGPKFAGKSGRFPNRISVRTPFEEFNISDLRKALKMNV